MEMSIQADGGRDTGFSGFAVTQRGPNTLAERSPALFSGAPCPSAFVCNDRRVLYIHVHPAAGTDVPEAISRSQYGSSHTDSDTYEGGLNHAQCR